jgi:hypothetical protein
MSTVWTNGVGSIILLLGDSQRLAKSVFDHFAVLFTTLG